MKFSEFSKCLERLETTASRLEITKILADLLRRLTSDEVAPAVFLSLGDLGPRYDNPDTGVSQKLMIRVLAKAFSVNEATVTKFFKSKGDLGQVAQSLGSEIKNQRSKIKIKEVFKRLVEVTAVTGAGSQEGKIVLLANLIREIDPLSQRYLTRIPMGTMRLGFSEKTILEALTLMETGAKEASFAKGSQGRPVKELLESKYSVYPNIGKIAEVFKSKGPAGLAGIKMRVGVPILAQLCQRLGTAEGMIEKMGRVAAEYKYDGVRLQVHLDREAGINLPVRLAEPASPSLGGSKRAGKAGNQELRQSQFSIFGPQFSGEKVKIFTRNLEQMQAMFPDITEEILEAVSAQTAIIDGEVVGVDPKTGKFIPFQETVQRKRKYEVAAMIKKIPVKYFAFDLLYKDGQDLTGRTYRERRQILKKTIKKNETVMLTESLVTTDAKELTGYFQRAKDKGLEGLIVKKYDGLYEAGNRGFNWVKFKREETGSLADTIDGVVLGYYKGTGKRTGFGIGALLVGVYDEAKEKFLTIAKIGTGLTDKEWREIRNQIAGIRAPRTPESVEIPKELLPDVLCQPKIVIVIRADEISLSPSHSSGYALRFPRMMGYRQDKTARQATTFKELKDLFKLQRLAT